MRNAACLLLLVICLSGYKAKAEAESATANETAQAAQEVRVKPMPPESPPRQPGVFSPYIIGVGLAYFEQLAGVTARRTVDNTKEYRIGRCDIEVRFDDGRVNSLRIPATVECSDFNLNQFLPNYDNAFPPLHQLTQGAFSTETSNAGAFYANCLYACGNAVDPSVYQSWKGSHADRGFEVILETALITEASHDAASAWSGAMMDERGEDWLIDGKFNCTRQYDALAHRLFANVPVSAIQIGYGLPYLAGDVCN